MEQDKVFKNLLMQKSKVVASDDFEENTMNKIILQAKTSKTKAKYIRLMILFFFIGLVLGVGSVLSIINNKIRIANFDLDTIIVAIPLSVLFVWLFDNMLKAFLYRKGNLGEFDM